MNEKGKNINRIITVITIVITACTVICWAYIVYTNEIQREEILREIDMAKEIKTPIAAHNPEGTNETGLFEDYVGSFVLSSEFSEEYILSLVSCDYNEELYYPVPDFAPATLITRYRDKFTHYQEKNDLEGFNETVYWNFYHILYKFDIDYYRKDDCAIPIGGDMQAFSDARKYWIYWNMHEELGEVEYTSLYQGFLEDATGENDSKSYWEEALEKQQEDAKTSAGVGDFIMYGNYDMWLH